MPSNERCPITLKEILAARDAPGGWTREQMEKLWGVPWPAPAFWKEHLVKHGAPYLVVDDGSDDIPAARRARTIIILEKERRP